MHAHIRRAIFGGMVIGAIGRALATEVGPGDITSLPWPAIWTAVGLATWGGIVASLGRSRAANEQFWPTLAKDAATSTVAGMAVFFIASHYGQEAWLKAFLTLLAGWGGARTLKYLYNRTFPAAPNDGGAP